MLPERPAALNADFDAENSSQARAARLPTRQPGAEASSSPIHISNYCPNCGETLTGHHCKLICTRCGYYLSCSDYY